MEIVELTYEQYCLLAEYLRNGLEVDGVHHKQYYLYKAANVLNLLLDSSIDKGIVP